MTNISVGISQATVDTKHLYHRGGHNSWQSDRPRATCARQSEISVGIATRDAARIPSESAKPIAPILNARSCAFAGSCPARKYAFTLQRVNLDNPSKEKQNAYYERPPHIPSRLMRRNTRPGARASGKYPNADSDESVIRRNPWMIEGIGIARVGRAGKPRERDERERNTVL